MDQLFTLPTPVTEHNADILSPEELKELIAKHFRVWNATSLVAVTATELFSLLEEWVTQPLEITYPEQDRLTQVSLDLYRRTRVVLGMEEEE